MVEHAERALTHDDDDPWSSDCPTCAQSWDEKFEARTRLETIIRKGGRRSRDVAARLAALDDRFEAATYTMGSHHRADHWWEARRAGGSFQP